MSNERPILRKQMVVEAVGRAVSPITVEHVAKYLPANFELDDIDLAPHVPMEAEPAPESKAEPFDWGALANRVDALQAKAPAAPEAEQATAEPEAPAPVQPGDVEAATIRRIKADSLVNNARVALITAQNVEKDARTKLANAVVQFQSGFERVTPEQLRREHVQEQQEIRRKIATGEMEPPPRGAGIGKSKIDQSAYWQKFGHGPAAGGGRAYAGRAIRDGNGNLVRDANGNFLHAQPSQKRTMPWTKPPSVR